MPRFFADIDDGHGIDTDDAGFEAPDATEAIRTVARALADMARDRTATTPACTFTATVRDASRTTAKLELTLRVDGT